MNKKIAFLIRDLNYGGAQRQLVTLAKGFAQRGLEVTVFYFYADGPLAKDLQESQIPAICLEKQGRWHLFSFFWRLIRNLRSIRPDVLHAYLGESNLMALFLKPLFPTTQIVWGIRESNTDPDLYGWVGRLLSQLECRLSRFADLIIVNSQAGQTYHVTQGYAADKMVVIPNGIDIDRFQPNPSLGTAFREKWNIPQDTILIGLVGRLAPMKDHPTFLQAASLLHQEQQDVRFVCIGTGPEEYAQELYQLTDELGLSETVIWTGGQADMPTAYNALNIAVSSSCYGEGFANAIGEAMACGVPCIVTDVGDSAWLVGNSAIVVPLQDPEALKTAMVDLIEKINRHECSFAPIRHRIVTQFSVPQLVQNTENVLLNLSHATSSY
ncbi:glycosyltransferase [Myxacorys almedinensis]|uniref:Glycosyltransferase n=1 Tax=Myxacorys almedinensis A TaxID=2690445 RepID=A0A8J7Z480_9CYAN|nr:glycosyltransferase [Myxacorys almedinensis]NDJ17881.1 glycosyltransferase [Myxacorys almedinensis A]